MVDIPIVSLDKIYIKPDEENIFFLDCTRINGTNEIVARKKESLDRQIEKISRTIRSNKIILADDVVFSGGVLRTIIDKFSMFGIETVGIIASISTSESYDYFNNNLRFGMRTNYLMLDNVMDQICERDFYFGIAGSGIMVRTNENELLKAPYFKPYGNPNERASIPVEFEDYFSRGCLERSIYLWSEIDQLRGTETKIKELPERIINTNQDDGVVKTLKKELKQL